MRPNTAPLTRPHPCRCKQSHPAQIMIAGLPLLVCPEASGPGVEVAFGKDGLPFFVIGEGGTVPLTERLQLRVEDVERVTSSLETALHMLAERMEKVERLAKRRPSEG